MSIANKVTGRCGLIGRLDCGSDLLEGLVSICKNNGISLGTETDCFHNKRRQV